MEELTAVRLVCCGHAQVAALAHAMHTIDAFLMGHGTQWTLESASSHGFVRLLDRLRQYEWPGFNHHFRDGRLNKAIRSAVKNGQDLRVLEWWIRRYMPDQKQCSMAFVFELAIQHAQLPVLKWLHQETEGRLPELPHLVQCYSPEVIYWLYDHGGRDLPVKLWLHCCSPQSGSAFIKWCIEHGDACKVYFCAGADAFNCAAESDLETMQQLLEFWPELCTPESFDVLVRQGNFEAAKWLYESRPEHYFLNLHHNSTGSHIEHRLGLESVRWIVFDVTWRNQDARLAWIDGVFWYAVRAGDVDLLESVNEIRKEIAYDKSADYTGANKETWYSLLGVSLMDEAALHGHVAIAQWLLENQSQCCTTKAMDSAAAKGHLDIVKWLHDNQFQGCTTDAMNDAAAGGHLEIVQWLHKNRNEGCTTQAMDLAAANGHLKLVQWLHENRSEGCTTDAMDLASRNGKLEVIQWLHQNRTEGCTTYAMDWAPWNGHVNVLQFLHTERNEGCTDNAMAHAAQAGYLEAFKWLHENRSEGCSEEALETENRDILDFIARSTTYFSFDRIIDALDNHGHFGTIDLILREAHAKGTIRVD